jgi:UDP-N-acetyl-D-mannosaminuronate dehydrogenase
VPQILADGWRLTSVGLDGLEAYDGVVIATDHAAVDYRRVVAGARLVLDTRDVTRGLRDGARDRVFGL